MKKTIFGFIFAMVASAMFVSCGNATTEVKDTDSTKVDSVMVDSVAADSVVADTVAVDTVKE